MTAVINFVDDNGRYDAVKPYIYSGPETSLPGTNIVYTEAPLNLTDVRELPDPNAISLETHGFEFIRSRSTEIDGVKDEANANKYAMEMAALLTEKLGATKAVPLHTRLRSANRQESTKAQPGTEAHIDTTLYDAWPRITQRLTPEERQLVLDGKYRARIINLWRPMINHAEDFPLALLDPSSIDYERDHVALDHVIPGYAAETAYLKPSPRYRWYWMSNMTPEDAVVFTQYDTHPPGGRFNHVGHASFRNPASRPGCPPRRSIEARFVVVEPAPYEKETTTIAAPRPEELRRQPWKEVVDMTVDPTVWKMTAYKDSSKVTS
ncbi:hypothetical protein NLU13_7054 [Sarocladium strictum]|uniref:Methyltransferase n=1 Tax=Sarocladium strictum TaxID=5046 RepID=A0AA39L6G3_SARSR|nr:hypothetical protein NLU13_7054 [Sarocladium strictum]